MRLTPLVVLALLAGCSRFDSAATPVADGGAPDAAADSGQACPESVDVTTDPKNCGSCGHDCLGGACVASMCGAVTLASGLDGPYELALDATHVYAVTAKALVMVGKDGTAFTTLKSDFMNARGVAVDGDDVFVADDGVNGVGGGVFHYHLSTKGSTMLAGTATNLTIDDTFVYYCAFRAPGLFRIRRDGTAASETIEPTTQYCESVRLDGDSLFFGAAIGVATPAKTATSSTALGNDMARHIAVDDQYVYGVNYSEKTIGRTPRTGDTSKTTPLIFNSDLLTAGDVAVDATHIYWTIGIDGGSVLRTAKSGPQIIETIASGLGQPANIALDDAAIYWTEVTGNTIKKRAK